MASGATASGRSISSRPARVKTMEIHAWIMRLENIS